jgi:hypothetical protein
MLFTATGEEIVLLRATPAPCSRARCISRQTLTLLSSSTFEPRLTNMCTARQRMPALAGWHPGTEYECCDFVPPLRLGKATSWSKLCPTLHSSPLRSIHLSSERRRGFHGLTVMTWAGFISPSCQWHIRFKRVGHYFVESKRWNRCGWVCG